MSVPCPSGRVRRLGDLSPTFLVPQYSGCEVQVSTKANERRRQGKRTRGSRGVELLEFALVLPLLLLLFLGIFDFGAAFALRQKMTNAARQAARILVSNSLGNQNCTSTTPCSVVAAANAMVHYMDDAGADLSCIQPEAPTSTGTLEWTYSCSNGISLAIDRGAVIATSDGVVVPASEVTFVYPFSWHLARFLPGYAKGAKLSTEVTMANLVD